MNSQLEGRLMEWHRDHGGHAGDPAAHALRLLREVVELCIASGSNRTELLNSVYAEIRKAVEKEELDGCSKMANMLEEFADVSMLLAVYRNYFLHYYDTDQTLAAKFELCESREWEADSAGVLWRPGAKRGRTPDRAAIDPIAPSDAAGGDSTG